MNHFVILEFVVPIVLALLTAYLIGHVLGSRFRQIPVFLKVSVAGVIPIGVVLGYFIVWDRIEYAKHLAENGDVGWMGPLVLLIYTSPMWVIVFGIGFLLSFLAVRRTQ